MPRKNNKNLHPHARILRKIIDEKKEKGYLLQNIADKMGYTTKALQMWMNSEKEFDKSRVIILKQVLNIDCNDFGISLDDISLEKTINPHNHTIFADFDRSEEGIGYENSINKFFGETESRFSNAEKSIYIYDYVVMNHSSNIERHKDYLNRNKFYLQKIESCVHDNKSIEYCRVLAIPISISTEKEEVNDKTKCFKYIINSLSYEKFEHLWTCFQKFNDRFYLFCLNAPSTLYSYACIDNDTLIIQQERYDANYSPHLHYVFTFSNTQNYVDRHIKDLNRFFRSDFKQLFNDGMDELAPNWRLHKDAFQNITRQLYLEKRIELSEAEGKLKEKERQKEKVSGSNEELKNEQEILILLNKIDMLQQKRDQAKKKFLCIS